MACSRDGDDDGFSDAELFALKIEDLIVELERRMGLQPRTTTTSDRGYLIEVCDQLSVARTAGVLRRLEKAVADGAMSIEDARIKLSHLALIALVRVPDNEHGRLHYLFHSTACVLKHDWDYLGQALKEIRGLTKIDVDAAGQHTKRKFRHEEVRSLASMIAAMTAMHSDPNCALQRAR